MDERHIDELPPVNPNTEQALQVPSQEASVRTPREHEAVKATETSPTGFVDPSVTIQPLPLTPAVSANPITASVPASAAPTTNQPTPAIADDADLIEKEWVIKAKEIVEQTKFDPHEQNKALNLMKADYLKKRYGRDLKVQE